ncbi:NAD(P)-dependent glycerol-3-phosphate dehydrogenase [SAR86 cluster bacterium]|nr:NAD(P)-dependent glycerol-3-phosphate dehydrogenase [SAR86 cluster bacterium]
MNSPYKKIGVLGAGSWGTVLADIAANNGYEVLIWSRNPNTVNEINTNHTNKKYSGSKKLHKNIKATSNQKDILILSHVIVCIPSASVRSFFKKNKKHIMSETSFLIASKGLEKKTFFSMSEILKEELEMESNISVLSGPNLASEIIEGMAAACVIAAKNKRTGKEFSNILDRQSFKVFLNNDVKGVELAGALKNIYAIVSGLSDGLGNKKNTKAMILTRSLVEMSHLFENLKLKKLTLLGLAGVGDLFATASSEKSRNYSFGYLLGKGKSREEAKKIINQVIEGEKTLKIVYEKVSALELDMPIVEKLYNIVFKKGSVKESFDKMIIESDGRDL